MIFQAILIVGLVFCMAYAFLQRPKSQLVRLGMSALVIPGIYFVLFPEHANELAHFVGIGRGADLLLYCWLLISLVVSINLQFKLLRLQGVVTDLAREIALLAVKKPPDR